MNRMTDSESYREFAVGPLLPSEVQWALNNDQVHGIADVLKDPVAIVDVASDDPDEDRKTYLIRANPDDVANAIVNINDWIADRPHGSPGALDAHGFVTALSSEGLTENAEDDDDTSEHQS